MKKYLSIFLSAVLIVTLVVGCGSKDDNINNGNSNTTNKDKKTSVNNLSESYTRFVEAKSGMTNKLTDIADESENFMLSMALLPLVMADMSVLPATICGLDELSAETALAFLYNDVKYNNNGNDCTVTFKTSEGEVSKFSSKYDPKTDSATMTVYDENDAPILISEYAKVKNGYASQYYYYDDGGTSIHYKSVFIGDNIYSSAFEDVSKPTSIFKNNKLDEDFGKGGTVWYIEYVDGVSKVSFNEE
ncbi:MAG: hypothetical protein PHW90_01820 [Bacilli bacterium]|nr:hypothetical protein [Bacilli bacterium]